MSILKSTIDSFQNFAARVGLGSGNQHDQSQYGFDFVSRDRLKLEAMYRSSWVVGQVVDVVAEDMTREGLNIRGFDNPEDVEVINQAMDRLEIWDKLSSTIKWGRLYGGCLAVMLIDGQRPETPLNTMTIAKGAFKGVMVLDRWMVIPSLHDLVTEYGPHYGKPKYYDVISDAVGFCNQRIHYSRIIRIDGVDLPYWQSISENLWGQSVIERLIDRLTIFDSATLGAGQLVYKAHLRTYKVDKLREIIAKGGAVYEALLKQINQIRQFQSNEGLTLMDSSDSFETHQYSFTGLDNVLLQFGQQISGAVQIPLVRLFGQSPAGMNSTGESDLSNYYDNINQQQERRLRTPLQTLLQVVCLSELGCELPKSFKFDFASLWQLDDEKKASIASSVTSTVMSAFENGIVTEQTALKELRQSSEITGIWSSITNIDIEQADDKPPAPNSENTVDAGTWIEEDHPRDENGQFSETGRSGKNALNLGFAPIHPMSSANGGKSARNVLPAPESLPSSETISTMAEAQNYWDTHFKDKTYALAVHSRKSVEKGGHEPIQIQVKFGDTNHAFSEKPPGASHWNEERVLSQERAKMLDKIIPTIQNPHVRLKSRGHDLMLEAPVKGRYYAVFLKWSDTRKVYDFESAHFRTENQIKEIQASQKIEKQNKNKGPLQK